ncbi:DUF3846 domain-containing protein [Candidatus Lokiarchaeum ossiferum]|uniref:DUF3846 domain-containing protein n=1 Tax=Candidatus Lokiarchaeum ossiferum TaxID=2951803 RepID=UPI00352C4C7C
MSNTHTNDRMIISIKGNLTYFSEVMTLAELQAVVGGLIEVVNLPDVRGHKTNHVMIVNEEFLVKSLNPNVEGMGVNTIASALAGKLICGNVLVIPRRDLN